MERNNSFVLNTFCYVFIMVFLGVTMLYDEVYNGFFPLSFVWYSLSVGAVSALITFIFFTQRIIKNCPLWLRMILFLICLVGYVSIASISFGLVDPSSIRMLTTMFVMIAVIFIVVWCVNLHAVKKQEREFSDRLREFNEAFDDNE